MGIRYVGGECSSDAAKRGSNAAAAATCAGLARHAAPAALAEAALVALFGWLGVYLGIAAPINRRMTKAAHDHQTPAAIRANSETMGLDHHNACGSPERRDGTAHRDSHQLVRPRPEATS